MKEKKVNIPNALTAVRLVLAPVVFFLVLFGQGVVALIVFVVAAVTDLLDGWTARHYGCVTKIGAYLDPIADKILMSGIFLALAIVRIVPWWFVVIVFIRDVSILVSVGVFFIFTSIRKFPPRTLGKISTLTQILTAVAWMIQSTFRLSILTVVARDILCISVVFTLWSFIDYAEQGIDMYKSLKKIN